MSLAMKSAAISGPQPNIYIPVHKRQSEKVPPTLSLGATASEDAPLSWSSASSMSSVLPRSAHFSIASDNVNTKMRSSFVYTIEELIRLRDSPLVFISPERREEIRRNVPQVYMNRKRRLERDSRVQHHAVKGASIRTNDTDGPHGHDDRVSPIPTPFSQYSQKLKRREKDQVDQTSRSAVLAPIQLSTQSHPVPRNPVDVLAKVSLVVSEAPRAITPLGYPQRRIKRFTERSRPKVVDELNWRGPRQRSWYTATQGAVSFSQ